MALVTLLFGTSVLFGQLLTVMTNQLSEPSYKGNVPIVRSGQLPNVQEPLDVEFCELVTAPQSFRDRLVRVRAVFETTFEWRRLYDDACLSSKNYVWPVFECDTIESCERFRLLLKKNMTGDPFSGQRVIVVLLGRFRETNNPKRGYGVQSGLRFQLEISKIETTERISKDSSQIKTQSSFPLTQTAELWGDTDAELNSAGNLIDKNYDQCRKLLAM